MEISFLKKFKLLKKYEKMSEKFSAVLSSMRKYVELIEIQYTHNVRVSEMESKEELFSNDAKIICQRDENKFLLNAQHFCWCWTHMN